MQEGCLVSGPLHVLDTRERALLSEGPNQVGGQGSCPFDINVFEHKRPTQSSRFRKQEARVLPQANTASQMRVGFGFEWSYVFGHKNVTALALAGAWPGSFLCPPSRPYQDQTIPNGSGEIDGAPLMNGTLWSWCHRF